MADVHAQQIIHREISRDNVLVADDGSVYLIDFGMASTMGPGDLALPHLELGHLEALAFISPEQTGRTNQPVDHRTDLYALGITL